MGSEGGGAGSGGSSGRRGGSGGDASHCCFAKPRQGGLADAKNAAQAAVYVFQDTFKGRADLGNGERDGVADDGDETASDSKSLKGQGLIVLQRAMGRALDADGMRTFLSNLTLHLACPDVTNCRPSVLMNELIRLQKVVTVPHDGVSGLLFELVGASNCLWRDCPAAPASHPRPSAPPSSAPQKLLRILVGYLAPHVGSFLCVGMAARVAAAHDGDDDAAFGGGSVSHAGRDYHEDDATVGGVVGVVGKRRREAALMNALICALVVFGANVWVLVCDEAKLTEKKKPALEDIIVRGFWRAAFVDAGGCVFMLACTS